MHKLDRASVAPPACLSAYDYQIQNWDNLDAECKRLLRDALVKMQSIPGVTAPESNENDLRCAYCEGRIYHNGHIEHFRRKNPYHFPQLTFDWTNLFLSCGSHDHCGHYKDRPNAPTYDPNQLIKPDEHDPERYLYFHSNGEVRACRALNNSDAHRATETIRVFGLDNKVLSGSRKRAVSFYRNRIAADLDVIALWPSDEREAYLSGEIEATCGGPYATTIKHFLQSVA